MKEATYKKPHILWLHVYGVSTTGKARETESQLGLEKTGGGETANGHKLFEGGGYGIF